MQEERLKRIQQFLYSNGASSIQALIDHTAASPATIRRDLSRLEQTGIVKRTHGGARLAEVSGLEAAFSLREYRQLEHKRAIAQTAHHLLRPQTTVLMDAGTTVLQLARAIRLNPLPLTVVTNGLALAQELLGLREVKVIFLGGHLRDDNLSSVGPYAEAMLEEFCCDQLFLGTTAVSSDGFMQTLDATEAATNKKMLARATERILLADSSKFNQTGPFKVAPLQRLTQVISDEGLSTTWVRRLGQLKIGLTRARVGA
jgi:DeoR family fructose operon transcriptional repressor